MRCPRRLPCRSNSAHAFELIDGCISPSRCSSSLRTDIDVDDMVCFGLDGIHAEERLMVIMLPTVYAIPTRF